MFSQQLSVSSYQSTVISQQLSGCHAERSEASGQALSVNSYQSTVIRVVVLGEAKHLARRCQSAVISQQLSGLSCWAKRSIWPGVTTKPGLLLTLGRMLRFAQHDTLITDNC